MTQDILTVMWKEMKNAFRHQSRSRFLLSMLTPIFFAILLPLQTGLEWTNEIFPSIFLSMFFPISFVAVTIPDAFAGERERHTLETLLASRLPDRAIFLAKFIFGTLISWIMAMTYLLISLITLNIAHWQGQILFFTPQVAFANISLSLFFTSLAAGTGILVSLHAETVQQAAQSIMTIIMVPPLILTFLLSFFSKQIGGAILNINSALLLYIVLAILLAADIVVLLLSFSRFKRSNLILMQK